MPTKARFVILGLLAASMTPSIAAASGGQPGIDIAVDAPWRIEPIPVGQAMVGGKQNYTYGPIPIVITVNDAVFDIARKRGMPILGLGRFSKVVVEELTKTGSTPTTVITADDLTEIEAKYGVSTKGQEPKHELCIPAAGMTNCDTRLPIDAGKGKVAQASHEWHASFNFTPKTKIVPGQDIKLRVTFYTTGSTGKPFSLVTKLKVHAGEQPLPRFSNQWLYGDLHYHSQSTDNEGEQGYAYRNVVRAMGAMGMDFAFATDHASDGVQALGGGGGGADGMLSALGYTNDFQEARDLNHAKFSWANGWIHGKSGANQVMQMEALAGGKSKHFANYRGYGVIPQIFLGEEMDSWPEMSAAEQASGRLAWGDRQGLQWWAADGCPKQAAVQCTSGGAACVKNTCRARFSEKKNGRWHLVDKQGASVFASQSGSRQHLLYLPYRTDGAAGWISGRTSEYGGGTKPLSKNLAEIQSRGRAFLAHPLAGGSPGNSAGPNMIPYSRTSLDMAWKSKGILGLQIWNEADHYATGPKDAFSGTVMAKDERGRRVYQPSLYRGSQWRWDKSEALSAAKCADCDFRIALYHGAFTWDEYLRKGLDPAQTKSIAWLPKGEPRRWSMVGGSDSHGDFNFRRHGRPNKCIKTNKVGAEIAQWCDTQVSDTAIGRPRNLVRVGKPLGPGSGSLRRHSNRQVIDSLEAGRFSVTDGPGLRIVVDKNRNGHIDAADYEMGSVVDLYPGEQIPVLVEWWSTPEFGPVREVDLYVGNKSKTFAAPGHGPNGRFRVERKGGKTVAVPLSEPYANDPTGVLGVRGLKGNVAMHGVARFELDPKQFGITSDGALMYVRAYAQTDDAWGGVAGRMAYANPVWGRYHASCGGTSKRSLDGDGNDKPDICEGKASPKSGSRRSLVAIGLPSTVDVDPTAGANPKQSAPTKNQAPSSGSPKPQPKPQPKAGAPATKKLPMPTKKLFAP